MYIEEEVKSIKVIEDLPYAEDALLDQHSNPNSSTDITAGEITQSESKKVGVHGTALNLINAIIGTGILGLPFVLLQLGIVFGVIGILISATFSIVSGDIILRCKNLSRKESLKGMAEASFGRLGSPLINFTQILNNFGLCVNYLMVFSITIRELSQSFVPECHPSNPIIDDFYCHRWAYVLIGGVLVFRMAFIESMAKLAFASAIKLVCLITFGLISVGFFILSLIEGQLSNEINILPNWDDPIQILGVINIVTLSFDYQFNMMPIYKSLEYRSDNKMRQSILIATGVALVLNLLVAFSGYLVFGSQARYFLQSYTPHNLGPFFFTLLNIAFGINCFLSFPGSFIEARRVICESILGDQDKYNGKIAKFNYFMVVLMLHTLIIIVAILATNLNAVFQLLGSTTTCAFTYIYPSLFYMKLSHNQGQKTRRARMLLTFGSIIMVFGVISSISKLTSQ